MAGGLRHIVIKRQVQLVANDFLVVHLLVFPDGLVNEGVHILAFVQEVEVESLMVDARAGVGYFIRRDADPPRQHGCRALHAVAQAGHGHVGVLLLHHPAQHSHGVGVVEVDRIGTIPGDVLCDVQNGVHRAQEAEDAAGAAGIAHIDIHPVFLGDEDIMLPDVHVPRQDGGDHPIRAP